MLFYLKILNPSTGSYATLWELSTVSNWSNLTWLDTFQSKRKTSSAMLHWVCWVAVDKIQAQYQTGLWERVPAVFYPYKCFPLEYSKETSLFFFMASAQRAPFELPSQKKLNWYMLRSGVPALTGMNSRWSTDSFGNRWKKNYQIPLKWISLAMATDY